MGVCGLFVREQKGWPKGHGLGGGWGGGGTRSLKPPAANFSFVPTTSRYLQLALRVANGVKTQFSLIHSQQKTKDTRGVIEEAESRCHCSEKTENQCFESKLVSLKPDAVPDRKPQINIQE